MTTKPTYNPKAPRPYASAPRQLTPETPVVIKLGPNHCQYNRLEPFARDKYIKGVIDWISPKHGDKVIEVRINCVNAIRLPGNRMRNGYFYLRVEFIRLDCYNYMDVTVVRRV